MKTQMSIKWYIHKCDITQSEKQKVLIHAIISINFENIMLNEIIHLSKNYMFPFI